jgi:hypothetical protein
MILITFFKLATFLNGPSEGCNQVEFVMLEAVVGVSLVAQVAFALPDNLES